MNKRDLTIIIASVIAGFGGTFLFLWIGPVRSILQNRLAVVSVSSDQQNILPSPTATPANVWQKIVTERSLFTVAVQTFRGPQLIRHGSGIILTSDGLIVTTADVAPYGSYVYQVMTHDKVFRAEVVKRDTARNLALIKVEATNLNAAPLDTSLTLYSGSELVVTGQIIDFSKPVVFAQRALVAYSTDTATVLDTKSSTFISGAAAITTNGVIAGMVFLRKNDVYLIPNSLIDGFLKDYLNAP